MSGGHTLYVTSSACTDIYPDNEPCSFTNYLPVPLNLDSKIEYEIGLVSVLYPNMYYAILAHDPYFGVDVYTETKINDKGATQQHHIEINMTKHILAGDMNKILRSVNTSIISKLKVYYGKDLYKKRLKAGALLTWNADEDKCVINHHQSSDDDEAVEIGIKFKKGLANILGMRPDTIYQLYGTRRRRYISAPIPVTANCGVESLYFYTDIIHPTPFGGQLTSILDCFTLENGTSKGINNTLYKNLKTYFIDQISIKIADQRGRKILFKDDSTVTCVLHIRPK